METAYVGYIVLGAAIAIVGVLMGFWMAIITIDFYNKWTKRDG